MNTSTVKINWDFISRLFLGLLFILAGLGKAMSFAGTSMYINSVLHTGSITPIVTSLTIIIEIGVASLFVWGKYKKDIMNMILIAFVALTTILFHNNINDPSTMIVALKNLAIIGGLIAMLDAVHKKRVIHHK
jgi:putative oxidoreductase